MPDPTAFVLTISFLSALVILLAAAVGRRSMSQRRDAVWMPANELPEHEVKQFPAPAVPPALPLGRVPVWLYQPLDLIGIVVIYLIFFALVIGSLKVSQAEQIELTVGGLITSIGFQFAIAGIAIAMVSWRINLIEWLGLRWPSWPWVFLIAPATVFSMWMIFGLLQATGYMKWMEALGVESVQETVKLLQTSKNPAILGLMAFAAVCAAPFCEEIVFRGYLYAAAKRFAGPWASGAFSALVFASAHGSLSALLPLFIFGCVLVFLYEKTGSLWAPIAVHFCFNAATVFVQLAVRYYGLPIDSVP